MFAHLNKTALSDGSFREIKLHETPFGGSVVAQLVKWGKGENSDSPLLQAQHVRDYLYGVSNGERKKRLLLAACAGLFPIFSANEQ